MVSLQVLSDQEKRKIYDKHGEEGLSERGGGDGFGDPFGAFSRYTLSITEPLLSQLICEAFPFCVVVIKYISLFVNIVNRSPFSLLTT